MSAPSACRPPTSASTPPLRGPRSGSTRGSPPTLSSARAFSPASAPRATASAQASRGSSAATEIDGNGLVENTRFGRGWVEGGALYPPHEEIYLQVVWIEASRGLAEMADAMGDAALAAEARGWAERTRAAVEATYWLAGRG